MCLDAPLLSSPWHRTWKCLPCVVWAATTGPGLLMPARAGSGSLTDLCLDSLWLPGTLHHQYTSSSLAGLVCASACVSVWSLCVCVCVCVCAITTSAAQCVSLLNHMVRLFPRVPAAWPISMVTSRRCGDTQTHKHTHTRKHTSTQTQTHTYRPHKQRLCWGLPEQSQLCVTVGCSQRGCVITHSTQAQQETHTHAHSHTYRAC